VTCKLGLVLLFVFTLVGCVKKEIVISSQLDNGLGDLEMVLDDIDRMIDNDNKYFEYHSVDVRIINEQDTLKIDYIVADYMLVNDDEINLISFSCNENESVLDCRGLEPSLRRSGYELKEEVDFALLYSFIEEVVIDDFILLDQQMWNSSIFDSDYTISFSFKQYENEEIDFSTTTQYEAVATDNGLLADENKYIFDGLFFQVEIMDLSRENRILVYYPLEK